MAVSTTKKKAASATAAVAVAVVLALGGTFAWQSISQTALNEASDVVNPGGRLHDDFYITDAGDYNADIYVENFADDEIFARVKLSEYMEVVVNQGVSDAEVVETVAGTKSLNGEVVADKATDNTSGYTFDYVTHYFDQANATDGFWDWAMGDAVSAEVWYMPTFNKNKDSLVADRNGMYVDRIGGISNRGQGQYEDWDVWAEGATDEGTEIYDDDPNSADEVGYDFENLDQFEAAGSIRTAAETHEAKPVGDTNGLISMSEWLDKLSNGEDTADYWVYDIDGWVYWSSPIAGGEATGLLLDSIELKDAMDDTWYYAIEATGQFVTAGDVGDGTEANPGFYMEGEEPTANAEALLEHIGAITKESVTVSITTPFKFTWTGSHGGFYDAESGYAPLTIETSDGGEYEWEWTVEGSVVEEGQDPSYVESWDPSLKVSPYEQASQLTVKATAVDNPSITGSLTIPVKSTNGMMIMVDDDDSYFGFNDLQFDNDNFAVFVADADGIVQEMTDLEILNTAEVDPNTKVVRGGEVTIYNDGYSSNPGGYVRFEQGFYVDIAPTEDASHVLLKATLEDGRVVEMYVSIYYDGIQISDVGGTFLAPGKSLTLFISNENEVPPLADGTRAYDWAFDWGAVDSSGFQVEETTHYYDWAGTDCSAIRIEHICEPGGCACVEGETVVSWSVVNRNSAAQSGSGEFTVSAQQLPKLWISVAPELAAGVGGMELYHDGYQVEEVVWSLKESVEGVTLEGNVLSATDAAVGKTVTVVATDPSGNFLAAEAEVAILKGPDFVLEAQLQGGAESLGCDESVTIVVKDKEGNVVDPSLLHWEIVDGGIYEDSEQPNVFIHYSNGTEEWSSCDCTADIRVTLKSDPSMYGTISVPCA